MGAVAAMLQLEIALGQGGPIIFGIAVRFERLSASFH
jgi:hypothetical protein